MEKRLEDMSSLRTFPSCDIMAEFLQRLGNPEKKIPPVIHVAGTNGKGSVLAFLKSILQQAGLSVHSTTSPHFISPCERIEIAGAQIAEDELQSLLNNIQPHTEGLELTYFEIITAAAFLAFSKHPADYVLLETGMGGLYDATNHVDSPLMTLLTPISIDHTDRLGHTLESIAKEKAGIIKQGRPILSAEQDKEVAQILSEEADLKDTDVTYIPPLYDFELGLTGDHQRQNAALAKAAAEYIGIDAKQIKTGLTKAQWPGRLEKVNYNEHTCWLDMAHNAAAAQALVDALKNDGPYHVIFSLKTSKEAKDFIHIVSQIADKITYVPLPGCFTADRIKLVTDKPFNVAEGFTTDLINGPTVVTGSAVLIGQARRAIDLI